MFFKCLRICASASLSLVPMALLCLQLANPSFAQSLPGPAADGWFVVIGQNPNANLRNRAEHCLAFITTSSFVDADNWEGVPNSFEPQQKYRYESMIGASVALRQAGWDMNQFTKIWFASSGCVVDQEKIRMSEERQAAEMRQRKERDAMASPNYSPTITAAQIEAVRQKIRPCVNLFSKVSKNTSPVTLSVVLDEWSNPMNTSIIDQGRYERDPQFRALADAIKKAVQNPRCQPWPLSPVTSAGQTLTLTFAPSDF